MKNTYILYFHNKKLLFEENSCVTTIDPFFTLNGFQFTSLDGMRRTK